MIVWVGVGALFLIYEVYAIVTKESKFPTLSRTIWDLQKKYPILRWIVLAVMVWATIHFFFGECAFGLC